MGNPSSAIFTVEQKRKLMFKNFALCGCPFVLFTQGEPWAECSYTCTVRSKYLKWFDGLWACRTAGRVTNCELGLELFRRRKPGMVNEFGRLRLCQTHPEWWRRVDKDWACWFEPVEDEKPLQPRLL